MTMSESAQLIEQLKQLGWYEIDQPEHEDTLFDGEFSEPREHWLFHPSYRVRLPFWSEDVGEDLIQQGLAVDLDADLNTEALKKLLSGVG